MGYKYARLLLWNYLQKWKKKSGKCALSGKEEDMEELLCTISIPQFNQVEEARIEWKQDEKIFKIIQQLQEDPDAIEKFTWKNDLL